MKPSSSSASNSNNKKNAKPTQYQQQNQQNNQRKRPAATSSQNTSSEELAIKAFLHHEFGYEKEAKARKITTGSESSSSLGEEELQRLSNDALKQKNNAHDCGEDFDKLGDLESVVCHLSKRIPTNLYSVPSSFLPKNCNFSILDHLKFLIPSVKKEIQEKKEQAVKKTLKQPSRKTKMAITTNKIPTETNLPPRSDKQKVRKLKTALNEILKKRETRLGIFGVMPYELLLQIFSFLDWKMLHKSINLVCKDWNDSISKYERYVISTWHHFDFFTTFCEKDLIIDSIENEEKLDLTKIEKPKTPILTCIVEDALLDYCNLNHHIIQPLLEDPNTPIATEILTPKVLDFIVPKVFPNVKYLTGKALFEYLINIFRYTVKFIDFKGFNHSHRLSSFGPFPNLEYLQWIDNRFFVEYNFTELKPLFENVKYLVLSIKADANFFSNVFEKSCHVHTAVLGLLGNAQVGDFCRAIEPHMKNIDPTNENLGLRKISFVECTLTKDAISMLGSASGHLLKVLHLNKMDSLDDGLINFQILEELSITNSKLRPSFIYHLISCPFGSSLKVLNLKGSNFNFSSIQASSIRSMQLAGEIVSGINNKAYSADAARRERVIEFKQDLVKILNWMIPVVSDVQKLNTIELKLVLTDYGEFYFQRNNKRNHQNRHVWRNRLPPYETVTVVRNRNGTCSWERL